MKGNWKRWLPLGGSGDKDGELRFLKLELELPGRRGEPNRKLNRETLIEAESWQQLIGHPIELLRRIEQFLKRINTENIAWETHQKCVARALQFACPAIRKLYLEQCDKDPLPESHDRREGLGLAVSTCHHLAVGFMHHLDRDYHLPLKQYSEIRSRVLITALRILELIHMEQRLRALRYQKLPRTIWLDVNRLFFTLYACEDVNTLLPGLTCMQAQVDPEISGITRKPPMTSLQQIFIAIHLFGLMDSNTLASQYLSLVEEFINRVANKIDVVPDDLETVREGSLLIYYGQQCPAYYERQDENTLSPPTPFSTGKAISLKLVSVRDAATNVGPVSDSRQPEISASLKLDVSYLESMLASERRQLFSRFYADLQEAQQESSAKFDLVKLVTVDTMYKHLYKQQRVEPREYVIGKKVLHVYNGFMPVYKLLAKQNQAENPEQHNSTKQYDLRDALAGRSTIVDWNLDSAEFGQWIVMDACDGGVHIKTHETPFTTAMFIGQILAFGYSLEELQTPTLGFITRLNRLVAGEIEVIIQILNSRPFATAVQSDVLSEKSMAFPGIILPRDDSDANELELVLHQSHRLAPAPDSLVKINVSGQLRPFHVAGLTMLQREFIVYTLQADELDNPDTVASGC